MPAGTAESGEVMNALLADEYPATLNVHQPCPSDVCAAVQCLWEIVRDLTRRVDQLDRQRM